MKTILSKKATRSRKVAARWDAVPCSGNIDGDLSIETLSGSVPATKKAEKSDSVCVGPRRRMR